MEFTSSSKSKHHRVYDVLINFSGEDIRRKFVSHLHSALSDAGINTFLDEEENLVKGMQIEELMQARDMSRIAIVVFTKPYLQSAWCLDELVQIIEWHQTYCRSVLPVFYGIDPSDVRRQKGDSGKALKATAEKSFSGEELEYALSRWSRALTKAASFFGWDESNCRNDAELVGKIIKGVRNMPVLSATKFPVGLLSHLKVVIQLIEKKSTSTEVSILGILGREGIGKTTLAKAVYNQIQGTFMYKSFIKDIKEVSRTKGHVHLQEQLLSSVLKSKVKIQSIERGITMIKERFSRKRVLVVLDDVNAFDQLNVLCGNHYCFGQGSVIIFTTTDKNVLRKAEVDYIYEIGLLNPSDSLELFSWHAFGKERPGEEYNEHAKRMVNHCKGIPLILEILGSYLFERTKEEWDSVFSKLRKMPALQILDIVKLCYDGLCNDMENDIFLDVCCFFIGKDKAYVTDILNGCGLCANNGIPVLIERSLIKVEKNNKLGMHSLLQELGREIIRESSTKEPRKHSRLWFSEDVYEVLTNNTGTQLKLHLTNQDFFEPYAFDKMEKLRLLQLDDVQLGGNCGFLSKKLKWIGWRGFPSKYIPNNFYPDGVIVIELKHSQLQLVWKEPQILRWLKILNLSHSKYLIETPDFLGLSSLEKLILKYCPSLRKIHKSIGDLNNLLLINLKHCTSLSDLPREIYKLKSLKTLILSGCLKIDILEKNILQMESLITLVAENTIVKQVPFSIVSSKSIGYISLCQICGFEGLSQNVFPSIIQSWMSPTMNFLSYTHPFCMDKENNNWGDLASLLSSLSNLRNVLVHCDTEFQLSKHVNTILVEYGPKFTELEISKRHLRSSLIGIGSYKGFFNTLNDSISEGLATSESCDVFLPGDSDPYWLAYMSEGHSVHFTVPRDCHIKGMILCVVYFSNPQIMATECVTSVLIVNHTKCTFQIHKRDTIISFDDEDWQNIISHLEAGDKVEIFMIFGHELMVKKTAVYVIYGESIDMEMELPPKANENALIRFIKKIVLCDFCLCRSRTFSTFQLHEDGDCCMKRMVLCVVYFPTSKMMTVECLTGVLIVNYTKCTIRIYKRDTVLSFNDGDRQGVISNLRSSDNVEIYVILGHGLTVLKTAIYLIYGQSIPMKMEQSPKVNMWPLSNVRKRMHHQM